MTTVTGTVQAQKKFESNFTRLIAEKKGESKATRIALIALGTIPALLSDAVRLILFKADLIDGKSFSVVDKVNAAWESYKNPTLQVQIERSEANLKAKAKELVKAYIALDRNFFNQTRHSFGSLDEQAIIKAQNNLLKAMESHLKINFNKQYFKEQSQAAKELVQQFLINAAGNELYIEHKAWRQPNAPKTSLASVVVSEFVKAFEATQGARFASVTKAEDFVAKLTALKSLNLTPEQTRKAVEQHLSQAFNQTLTTVGLKAAGETVKMMQKAAVAQGLVTEKSEITDLDKFVQETALVNGTLQEFAVGVAKDIVRDIPESKETRAKEELTRINAMATSLVPRVIKENEKSIFNAATLAQVDKMRKMKAEQAKAYKALNGFAKGKITQRAAEKEAIKLAEEQAVAAAARKGSIFDKLSTLLALLTSAKDAFSKAAYAHALKVEEHEAATKQFDVLVNTKVKTKKGSISLLVAEDLYNKEFARINQLKGLTSRERQEMLKTALFTENDQAAITLIQKLMTTRTAVSTLNQALVSLESTIKEAHDKVNNLLGLYQAYKNASSKWFNKDEQGKLSSTEKALFSDIQTIEKPLKALGLSKPKAIDAGTDLEALVDTLIESNKPKAPKVAAPKKAPSIWDWIDAHANALVGR